MSTPSDHDELAEHVPKPLKRFAKNVQEELKDYKPGRGDALSLMTIRKARAVMLLQRGETYETIHKETGLNQRQIVELSTGRDRVPREIINALYAVEQDKLTVLMHRMLDSINEMTPSELQKLSAGTRMTIAAIALDKRRLLEGNPTQIIDMRRSDDSILEEMREIRKKLAIEADYEVLSDLPEPDSFESA